MVDTSMKILVIDDDTTMRRIIKNLLSQIGFINIIEAEDGQAALDILQGEGGFGLLVSDWDMPRMTGLELLQTVRDDENFKTLPFIMVTAKDSREYILEAVKARVSQYIVKPFTAQALREKIEKVLQK
ncbi:MAG: response regulator [Thermodesulfobacteriota bacterium]|nr:response regulator [Thermodesulfobacteriota bacterium]